MMFTKRAPGFIAVVAILFGFTTQAVYAQQSAQPNKNMTKFEAVMTDMKKEMAEIEAQTDPAKRDRLLKDHMENMHKAMTLMQKEMMPSMRNMHRHKKPGSVSSSDNSDSYNTEAHMQDMEAVMSQMEELMSQMSEHRRALEMDQ